MRRGRWHNVACFDKLERTFETSQVRSRDRDGTRPPRAEPARAARDRGRPPHVRAPRVLALAFVAVRSLVGHAAQLAFVRSLFVVGHGAVDLREQRVQRGREPVADAEPGEVEDLPRNCSRAIRGNENQ